MFKRNKSKLKQLIVVLFVFVLLVSFACPSQARSIPENPPSSINLWPEHETQVQIIAENILMEIDASAGNNGVVLVTADFTMYNHSEQEDQMWVQFPAAFSYQNGNNCDSPYVDLMKDKQISNFEVWVNEQPADVQDSTKNFTSIYTNEPFEFTCLKSLYVKFPPEENTQIRLSYAAYPYLRSDIGLYDYTYMLGKAEQWHEASWYGDIGEVDMVIRFPYALNDNNFFRAEPEVYTKTENEIHWHFDAFLSDGDESIVKASVFAPQLWNQILIETKNTDKNPLDGAAWGRLAKAYKEGISTKRGMRADAIGRDQFERSKNAYLKAIELSTDNADYYYEYAELYCDYAEAWSEHLLYYQYPELIDEEPWLDCVLGIKDTLDLFPNHEKALDLAEYYANSDTVWIPNLLRLENNQPDYLYLTPTAASTSTITQTVVVSTPIPSSSPNIEVTNTQVVSPITDQDVPEELFSFPWYAYVLILLFGICGAWVIVQRRRHG